MRQNVGIGTRLLLISKSFSIDQDIFSLQKNSLPKIFQLKKKANILEQKWRNYKTKYFYHDLTDFSMVIKIGIFKSRHVLRDNGWTWSA